MVHFISFVFFICIFAKDPTNSLHLLVGLVIGFILLLLGDIAGKKSAWAKKWSVYTFLHEGAHYLLLNAFRLGPIWSTGQPFVKLREPPRNCVEVSFVYLAPLMVWWFGLVFWSYFRSSSNFWLAGVSAIVLVVLTEIGNPGGEAPIPGDGDWEQAKSNGCRLLNVGLIFVGVAISIFGFFYH